MPGLALPSSSLRAARGMPMQMPGMNQPPMFPGAPAPGPPGGLAKPTPAQGPAPTGYTSSGQPYSGIQPGAPQETLTPTGPALRQVQPGGNIVEWQPNQGGAPARDAGPMPIDPGGVSATANGGGGAPGDSSLSPFSISEITNLLDRFKPQQLPREYGAGPEDERAAQSAAFGRAADRIGKLGQGKVRSLKNYYSQRGLLGSPLEARGVAQSKNATAGQLGDVINEQAIQQLQRTQNVNDRNLASNVQQRGQDLSQADWQTRALPSIISLLRAGARPY